MIIINIISIINNNINIIVIIINIDIKEKQI